MGHHDNMFDSQIYTSENSTPAPQLGLQVEILCFMARNRTH